VQLAELLDKKGLCANYVSAQIQQLTFLNALSAFQSLQLANLNKAAGYIIEPKPNKKNLMKYATAASMAAFFHESLPNVRIETAQSATIPISRPRLAIRDNGYAIVEYQKHSTIILARIESDTFNGGQELNGKLSAGRLKYSIALTRTPTIAMASVYPIMINNVCHEPNF